MAQAKSPKGRQASVPPPEPSRFTERLNTFGVCGALFVAVLVVYLPCCQHDFIICDDDVYTYRNPHAEAGLTWDNIKWSLTGVHVANWHPLTWLSHMLDCELYRDPSNASGESRQWAGGHHLTNVLLHALGTAVLFLAMRRPTPRRATSPPPSTPRGGP